jgi:hypothetical protein
VRSRRWQMKESDVRTAEGICTRRDKDEATQCCFVLVMGCCFLFGVCLRSGQLAGGNRSVGSLRYRNRSPVKCCQWLASEC